MENDEEFNYGGPAKRPPPSRPEAAEIMKDVGTLRDVAVLLGWRPQRLWTEMARHPGCYPKPIGHTAAGPLYWLPEWRAKK